MSSNCQKSPRRVKPFNVRLRVTTVAAALCLAPATTAQAGPITDYPKDDFLTQSPFAAKGFVEGQKGWATPDGEFIAGAFVGWDPKTGDPIMMVGDKFMLGETAIASIPAGYALAEKTYEARQMTNIATYRSALDSGASWWSRSGSARNTHIVVTENGAIRALLRQTGPVAKGKNPRRVIMEGTKLMPFPDVKGSVIASDYKLDAFLLGEGDLYEFKRTLVRKGAVQWVSTPSGDTSYSVSYYSTAKGAVSSNSSGGLRLGSEILQGQSNGHYDAMPYVKTGNFYSAFLTDGSIVRKQTVRPSMKLYLTYGPVLTTDAPMYTADEETISISVGSHSLKAKLSEINSPTALSLGSPANADFIAAILDNSLYAWFFEKNIMTRCSKSGEIVTKQLSNSAGQVPEILGVSPGRGYAVVRLYNLETRSRTLILIDLRTSKCQAISLRDSESHSVAFVGEDEICVKYEVYKPSRQWKLYRESIATLMATAN